ncbi:MAG: hypothetical protein P1V13_21575 [Rhizobiaceae bacterium]|nr:hypothetical protein [Rhizobiaceae bacterium]
MPIRHARTAMGAALALMASTHLALALDAEDFAGKLIAAYSAQGTTVHYSKVTAQGDRVTIEGMAFDIPSEWEDLEVGDIVFEGVREDGSGGFKVASVTRDSFEFPFGKVRITLADLVITDLRIPGSVDMKTFDKTLFFNTATTGPLTVQFDGAEFFRLSSSRSTNVLDSSAQNYDFDLQLDGLEVDPAQLENADFAQTLTLLGYEKFRGNASIAGHWNAQTGEFSLSEAALTLDDVGRLETKFSVTGYTLDVLDGMQKMSKQVAQNAETAKNDPQADQALMLATMGLMQQLNFQNLSLRFEDASLTNKVLDFLAAQRGTTRELTVQGLKGMLPFALLRLQNPEFQQRVTSAVGAFLDSPESIEISAKPDTPLPFAAVAGSAMTAPQTLPDILNVTVTAGEQ